MDGENFELTVSVQDDQYAGAVVALVDSVARQVGCGPEAAAAFAASVDAALRRSLAQQRVGELLPVLVRRQDGPVEVLINGDRLTLNV